MTAVMGAGLTVVEPKLEDIFNVFMRKLKIDVNCVKIGTIQSVDYTTMTASIQIAFQQQMRDGTYQKIPPLADVPLFTLQGGGYSLQFPIAVGDTALVVFADRNIDNWFKAGGVMPPADGRLHALSDAIALVGLNALAANSKLSPSPSSTEVRLVDRAGTTKVGLQGGKVTVQNAGGSLLTVLTSLRQAVTDLVTVLNTLTTTGGPTTQTVSAATVAALVPVTAELTNVQTALGALLY
jgi:hypothetical protein